MPQPLIVGFYAGPGAGKSSLCAGLFAELKWRGLEVEEALEFAKDKVWEESFKVLEDQIYIFGKQLHRINRLADKVDVILTDSPLLFSLIYAKDASEAFKTLVLEEHRKFPSLNIRVLRQKIYNPAGRMQTEAEAKRLDVTIAEMLTKYGVETTTILGSPSHIPMLADLVEERLKLVKSKE